MEQREEFIKEMLKKDKPFKHLCAEFGISEKTGHKWKKRYLEEGKRGLFERPKVPGNHPNQLSEDVVLAIVGLKHTHPYWGPKKILELLIRAHPSWEPPSLSSVSRVLAKAGLVRKRRVRRVNPEDGQFRNRIEPTECNQVWAIDFKGHWTSDGECCEPLTIRDLYSRYPLCVHLMKSRSAESVKTVMQEVFRKYGLPKVIRSDNGTPFTATNGTLGLTKLSAWWISLGILPDRTEKGKPGQNGSLERFHADIAREIEKKIPGGRQANQAALDAWVQEYRNVRPNEAIGMKTPAEVYTPSPRKYTEDFDVIEYPAGYRPRKVSKNGTIKVNSTTISVGSALAKQTVGLRPLEEGNYRLYLADQSLGIVSVDLCCFLPEDGV